MTSSLPPAPTPIEQARRLLEQITPWRADEQICKIGTGPSGDNEAFFYGAEFDNEGYPARSGHRRMLKDEERRLVRAARLEQAETVRNLLTALEQARQLPEQWRIQAETTQDMIVGFNYSHGLRLTLRSCAEKLEAALGTPATPETKP
jgi:hypothetical protein